MPPQEQTAQKESFNTSLFNSFVDSCALSCFHLDKTKLANEVSHNLWYKIFEM